MRHRTKIRLRRRALRATFYAATPIVIFLALRLIWGWAAYHQLAAMKRELVARGVDFGPQPAAPAGPEDQNPIPALRDIAKKIDLEDMGALWEYFYSGQGGDRDNPQWTQAYEQLVQKVIGEHKGLLDQVDAVEELRGPAASTSPRDTERFGYLMMLQEDDALLRHEGGDDAGAVHRIQQELFISRIECSSREKSIDTGAVALQTGVAQQIVRIAPSLRLEPSGGSLAEARVVLHDVQDVQPFLEATIAGTKARVADAEEFAFLGGDDDVSWWSLPLFVDQARADMAVLSWELDAAHAPNWPAAESLEKPAPFSLARSMLSRAVDLERTSDDLGAEPLFTMEYDCAAASILLAAQIYRQEHGVYPDTAAEMVPELFSAVPIDVYDPGGSPMQYRVGAGGPAVWGARGPWHPPLPLIVPDRAPVGRGGFAPAPPAK